MRKLLQNKAVVAALSVVAVASVAANFVKLPKGRLSVVNARQAEPVTPAPAEGQYHIHGPAFASLAARPWRELYPIQPEARDPFAPAVLPNPVTVPVPREPDPGQPPRFQLQAVSLDGSQAFAVINQVVLREGESIAGYQVAQIEPRQVRLTGPLGPIIVVLMRTTAQKPPTGMPSNADLPAATGAPTAAKPKS